MTKVIRDSLFSLFYYWGKPVMDRHGCYRQNGYFMTAIRTQCWFMRSSNSSRNWYQGGNSQPIPDRHTLWVIQIPIVTRYFALPWLRPAVSSLGACPTPAR